MTTSMRYTFSPIINTIIIGSILSMDESIFIISNNVNSLKYTVFIK